MHENRQYMLIDVIVSFDVHIDSVHMCQVESTWLNQ